MIVFGRRPAPAPDVPPEAANWRVPRAGRDNELAWRQASALRGVWELMAGSETLARLTRRGQFRPTWTLASGEGAFTLPHDWRGGVEIRRVGEDTPLACFRPNWLGRGPVVLADGTSLQWASPKWWSEMRELRTAEDEPRILVRPLRGFLRYEAEVELDPRAAGLSHLTALLAFTWWLVLRQMAHRRSGH